MEGATSASTPCFGMAEKHAKLPFRLKRSSVFPVALENALKLQPV